MTIYKIFYNIICCLEDDNCTAFPVYPRDFKRVFKPLNLLYEEGYFQDSTKNLDGSFWQIAAGEETEAKNYFNKNKRTAKAYSELSSVLNEIFER